MGFDEYFGKASGILINKSGPTGEDGGDSAQMMGLYRFGRWMKLRKDKDLIARERAKFSQELDILTYTEGSNGDMAGGRASLVSFPGIYVRHPKPCYPGWAANPHCFSRDQHRALVVAMGALKQKKKLAQTLWQHIKRLGWYQNDEEIDGKKLPLYKRDLAAPDILGEYIRAFYMAGIIPVGILWPLLLATDLSALVGLLGSLVKWYRDPKDVDDDNQILTVLQAKVALPTPISWLTRKIYKRFRPGGPIKAFETKHRAESGSPPFMELYGEILEKEL